MAEGRPPREEPLRARASRAPAGRHHPPAGLAEEVPPGSEGAAPPAAAGSSESGADPGAWPDVGDQRAGAPGAIAPGAAGTTGPDIADGGAPPTGTAPAAGGNGRPPSAWSRLRAALAALPVPRLIAGIAIVVVGLLVLLGVGFSVSWTTLLQWGLLLVGLVLVALWRSGSSSTGLVVVGLVLGALLLGTWRADAGFDGGIGTKTVKPVMVAPGGISEDYGLGQLTIDLRKSLLSGTVPLRARVGAGRLVVIVPNRMAVVGRSMVGGGLTSVYGKHQFGIGTQRNTAHANFPGVPTVFLDLGVGVGSVEVRFVAK